MESLPASGAVGVWGQNPSWYCKRSSVGGEGEVAAGAVAVGRGTALLNLHSRGLKAEGENTQPEHSVSAGSSVLVARGR